MELLIRRKGHVAREAEVRAMQLHVKGGRQPRQAGSGEEQVLPMSLQKEPAPSAL